MTVQMEVFQTQAVQAPSRVDYWNQVANAILGAIAIRPSSAQFKGQIKRRRFGDMQLVQIQSTPVAVHGGSFSTASAQGLFLLTNQRGSCRLEQCGRETWLAPGELTLLRADKPYRLECGQVHETLILHVPVNAEAHGWNEHLAAAHSPGESELLLSFMRRLSAVDASERGPAGLLRTALDLLELTWPHASSHAKPAPARASAAAWEQRIRVHVECHLNDPELDAAAIAGHLGISVRYVHALFARMGTTASAYILESRLQRAAQRLGEDAAEPIGELAFGLGFNDLSHFCRGFRKRFGVSARAFRSRALS